MIVGRIRFWCILLGAMAWGILSCSKPALHNDILPTTTSGLGSQPIAVVGSQPLPPVDVLTQHNDAQRTGANLQEIILTPEKVASGSFGRLFGWRVDGQIYAQPLYVSRVMYKGDLIDIVVVATMKNNVYAFRAPRPDTAQAPKDSLLWCVGSDAIEGGDRCAQKNILGDPVPFYLDTIVWQILGPNIDPWIGITSTPVIDKKSGTIYLMAKSLDSVSHEVSFQLFALDLLDGHLKDKSSKIVRAKKCPKEKSDKTITYTASNLEVSCLDPRYQLQRAGLLETTDKDGKDGRIYVGFGTHMDTQPSHGWLLAYNAADLRLQPIAYCTTCGTAPQICQLESYKLLDNGGVCMGGIWQAGGGPAADVQRNVYFVTGNGSYTGEFAGTDSDIGDRATSFIKLDKDLNLVGSWTPANYACLNRTDADLGSAGPLFISDLSILIGGGKEGRLYALKPGAFHGTQIGESTPTANSRRPCDEDGDPTPTNDGSNYWSIQAAPPWESSPMTDVLGSVRKQTISYGFHHIHGSPVLWKVHDEKGDHWLIYTSAERDLLRAYEFNEGFGLAGLPSTDDPASKPQSKYESVCANSGAGMPGGFLTLSANGDSANSGIIWASMPRWNEDAVGRTVPGILRAYRAYPNDGSTRLTEIWNSDAGVNVKTNDPKQCGDTSSSGTEDVGYFAKFAPPTVAEGKVYLASFSDMLWVYGLKPTLPPDLNAANSSYNAILEMSHLQKSMQPGSAAAVTIVATNTGTAVWHPDDGISLSSSTIPPSMQRPLEGDDALRVRVDVPPQQKYAFNFHLVMPTGEARYYLQWRLIRRAAKSEQTTGDWFGSSTPEWKITTLRKECADLRDRTKVIAKEVSSERPLRDSLKTEINTIVLESQRRRCLPQLEVDDPMVK